MRNFLDISVYKLGLITAVIMWFFLVTDVFPRLYIPLEVGGANVGFWLTHLLLYDIIWLVVYFLQANLGTPALLRRSRSPHGVSQVLDWLIAIAAFLCFFAAFGARTLTSYMTMSLCVAVAGAAQSIFFYQERRRRLPVDTSPAGTILPIAYPPDIDEGNPYNDVPDMGIDNPPISGGIGDEDGIFTTPDDAIDDLPDDYTPFDEAFDQNAKDGTRDTGAPT